MDGGNNNGRPILNLVVTANYKNLRLFGFMALGMLLAVLLG